MNLLQLQGSFSILFIIIQALSAFVFYWVSGEFLNFQIFEGGEYRGGYKEASWHGFWSISIKWKIALKVCIFRVLLYTAFTDWNDHLHYFFINNLLCPSSINNVFLTCCLAVISLIFIKYVIFQEDFFAQSYCESAYEHVGVSATYT